MSADEVPLCKCGLPKGAIACMCAEPQQLGIPAEPPRLAVEFDPVTDCLTVEGIKYDGQMFRNVARWKVGSQYRIEKREDGIVTMVRITGGRRAG